eukprot:1160716-Pelagomonas_calceolata.AAC.8
MERDQAISISISQLSFCHTSAHNPCLTSCTHASLAAAACAPPHGPAHCASCLQAHTHACTQAHATCCRAGDRFTTQSCPPDAARTHGRRVMFCQQYVARSKTLRGAMHYKKRFAFRRVMHDKKPCMVQSNT